jgi:hypothetical protein
VKKEKKKGRTRRRSWKCLRKRKENEMSIRNVLILFDEKNIITSIEFNIIMLLPKK